MASWKPKGPPIPDYPDSSPEEQEALLAEVAEVLYKMDHQFEKQAQCSSGPSEVFSKQE